MTDEAEVFKAKSESLGLSITQLQKQLEVETLDKNKIKNLNTRLVDSVKEERNRNKSLKENNDDLFIQINEKKNKIDKYEIQLNDLNKIILEKSEECLKLGKMLKKEGETSGDVLNNALSDRISDLEESNKKLIEEKKQITSEKNLIDINYNKIKNILEDLRIKFLQ